MNKLPDKIYQSLKERIVRGDFNVNNRLPTIQALAKTFNVSESSIKSALGRLDKDGLIERFRGSGIFIKKRKGKDISFTLLPSRKNKAERIAEDLTNEIANGNLKIGSFLPLAKILKFQYKATYATIKEAINILLIKKLVHQKHTRLIIGNLQDITFQGTKGSVYIIGEPLGSHREFDSWARRQFFETFETELQKHGIPKFFYTGSVENIEKLIKAKGKEIQGFLLDFDYLSTDLNKLENEIKAIINMFEKTSIPLVIDRIDSLFIRFPEIWKKRVKNIYPIWREGTHAGELCGSFLASHGHRNAAFFSVDESRLVRDRFLGMEGALKQAFNNNARVEYVINKTVIPHWKVLDNIKIPMEKRKLLLEPFCGFKFKRIDPLEELYFIISELVYKDNIKQVMEPFFEKILHKKDITAWVCTEAIFSTVASEFLEQRGIKVPEQINLISMGSNEAVMSRGITAFDNQRDLAGYLAAHCILGDIPMHKTKEGFVEYKGRIIERRSTKAI